MLFHRVKDSVSVNMGYIIPYLFCTDPFTDCLGPFPGDFSFIDGEGREQFAESLGMCT